jgi:hypothetical protein
MRGLCITAKWAARLPLRVDAVEKVLDRKIMPLKGGLF